MEAERFSQSITRPLQEISSEMVRMDDDYTRFQFEKCPYEEINVIADTTTRMSRNMKKYLERIEKEKQIRQEFFSNASHELKTTDHFDPRLCRAFGKRHGTGSGHGT